MGPACHTASGWLARNLCRLPPCVRLRLSRLNLGTNRVWNGPDVDEGPDLVAVQQLEEPFHPVVGVADGEDGVDGTGR